VDYLEPTIQGDPIPPPALDRITTTAPTP